MKCIYRVPAKGPEWRRPRWGRCRAHPQGCSRGLSPGWGWAGAISDPQFHMHPFLKQVCPPPAGLLSFPGALHNHRPPHRSRQTDAALTRPAFTRAGVGEALSWTQALFTKGHRESDGSPILDNQSFHRSGGGPQ